MITLLYGEHTVSITKDSYGLFTVASCSKDCLCVVL